nr:hypothetical protein SYMBAF_70055 [Serratia symbiotica]
MLGRKTMEAEILRDALEIAQSKKLISRMPLLPQDDIRSVRVVFSLDCCDREAISGSATTGGISSEIVQDLPTENLEKRFGNTLKVPHPIEWLMDNGSCYIADATRTFARSLGFIVCTTPVRSPESNGTAESFMKTFKRDYVYVNDLPDTASMLEKLAEWMADYNNWHPHKGLKMRSPREYREAVLAVN